MRTSDRDRPAGDLLSGHPLRAVPHRLSVGGRGRLDGAEIPQCLPGHGRLPAAALASLSRVVLARAGQAQGPVRYQLSDRRSPPRPCSARGARARSGCARRGGQRNCPHRFPTTWRTAMIGTVYNMPPQPPEADNTTYLEAGAVSFGVEYRVLDPEMLRETYKDNPAQLAEREERSPEGGFYAEGLSLHVVGSDGHEYLRFDLFDNPPHYHYNHPVVDGVHTNNVIDYDASANGPMLDWAL